MPFIPDQKTPQAVGRFVPDAAPVTSSKEDDGFSWKDAALAPLAPIEAGANTLSGMAAKPVSDVAGTAAAAYDYATGGKANGDPEAFRKHVQDELTYKPRGAVGKGLSDTLNSVLSLPGKAVSAVSKPIGSAIRGGAASDTLRGAAGNAVEEGINQGAGFAAGKGIKSLKGMTDTSAQAAAQAATEKSGQAARVNQVRDMANKEGYVVPATQAESTLWNHIKETVSGGAGKSQKKASLANQEVTNDLVRKTLGMQKDIPITKDNLEQLRSREGAAYTAIEQWGSPMHATKEYVKALSDIRQKATQLEKFQSSRTSGRQIHEMLSDLDKSRIPPKDAVFLMRRLREDARNNLNSAKAGGGDSVKTDLGNAQKAAATALEDMVEKNLYFGGAQDLASQFKRAREKIAQSYTVEKALNPSTGDVSAVKLYNDLKGGKMVGGDMRKAAEFAGAFPKSNQVPASMGSTPALNNLDLLGAVISPKGAIKAAAKPLFSAGSVKPPKAIAKPSPTVIQALNRLAGSKAVVPATVGIMQPKGDQLPQER